MRRIALVAIAFAAVPLHAAAAGDQAVSWTSAPGDALTPGSAITWYRDVAVAGTAGTYRLTTITWPLADARYRAAVALPGERAPVDGWLARRGLAAWIGARRPPGLVAALSPDYGTYRDGLAHTSGLLVRAGVLLHLPSGTAGLPSVGYTSDARMVFGSPRAVPLQLRLAGTTAAVDALESLPARPDAVALYRRPGERVTLPAGYTAVALAGDLRAGTLRRSGGTRVAGDPVLYTLHQGASAPPAAPVAFRRLAAGPRTLTVPDGGALLVTMAGGAADNGLRGLSGGVVDISQTDPAWALVEDVMGGKPRLVSGGRPIAVKPMTVTAYQWSAAAARAAVGQMADGRGVLAVVTRANRSTDGVDMPTFGAMLSGIGVRDAIGLDGGPVPALVTPLLRSRTCAPLEGMYCFRASSGEFAVPAATVVTYAP